MKSKIPAVLILCVLSVVPALAQTTPSNATNVANPPDWFIVSLFTTLKVLTGVTVPRPK